jgi:hypothetical protein
LKEWKYMKKIDIPKLIGANGIFGTVLVLVYSSDAPEDLKIAGYGLVLALMVVMQVAALYAPSPKD